MRAATHRWHLYVPSRGVENNTYKYAAGAARSAPLVLSAAKSAAGHAEAAAGMVGFAAAALAVEGMQHPGILHLRCFESSLSCALFPTQG
jgi:3-oxoacyl-(acyl-carrier-protein) synthase